jgi:hypothetical protein
MLEKYMSIEKNHKKEWDLLYVPFGILRETGLYI